MNWKKLGLIVEPNLSLDWMSHGAGPSFAKVLENGELEIFVSGRDNQNRSRIGTVYYDLNKMQLIHVSEKCLFPLGELGTFDFNGVSYPWIVEVAQETRLYYTGWTRGFHVSFINDLGLAVKNNRDTNFNKISRAPLIPRSNDDPFGIGSVCVLHENSEWKMWYTCFKKWGDKTDPDRHFYHIKYATSTDGFLWKRDNIVAIDFNEENGEYVTGKPSVLKYRDWYLMWFSYRGASYKLGFAISHNGIDWKRMEHKVGIDVSSSGFDSEMICYGHIFSYQENLYMVYNGNGYGRSGLGLARLPLKDLDNFLETV